MTGASGSAYALATLRALHALGTFEVHSCSHGKRG